jgi:hypothetical protein
MPGFARGVKQPRVMIEIFAFPVGEILMKQRLLVSSIIMGLCATLAAGTVFAQADTSDQPTTDAKK